jgi:hypothetical protein
MTSEPVKVEQALEVYAKAIPHDPLDLEPAPPPRNRSADETKALAILEALAAGGLKPPFEFDLATAKQVWGAKLGEYKLADLMDGVNVFLDGDATTIPTVGQFEAAVRSVIGEHRRDDRARVAQERGTCSECEDVRWVRIEDGIERVETLASRVLRVRRPDAEAEYIEVPKHHYRPCTVCLPERFDLYQSGHWTPTHIEAGGCRLCRPYHEPWTKESQRYHRKRKAS